MADDTILLPAQPYYQPDTSLEDLKREQSLVQMAHDKADDESAKFVQEHTEPDVDETDVIIMFLSHPIDTIRLIYQLKHISMKNWKTTLFGVITAIPVLLHLFGLVIPPDIAAILTAIGGLGLGVTAKDNNVTGGTVQQ